MAIKFALTFEFPINVISVELLIVGVLFDDFILPAAKLKTFSDFTFASN